MLDYSFFMIVSGLIMWVTNSRPFAWDDMVFAGVFSAIIVLCAKGVVSIVKEYRNG